MLTTVYFGYGTYEYTYSQVFNEFSTGVRIYVNLISNNSIPSTQQKYKLYKGWMGDSLCVGGGGGCGGVAGGRAGVVGVGALSRFLPFPEKRVSEIESLLL